MPSTPSVYSKEVIDAACVGLEPELARLPYVKIARGKYVVKHTGRVLTRGLKDKAKRTWSLHLAKKGAKAAAEKRERRENDDKNGAVVQAPVTTLPRREEPKKKKKSVRFAPDIIKGEQKLTDVYNHEDYQIYNKAKSWKGYHKKKAEVELCRIIILWNGVKRKIAVLAATKAIPNRGTWLACGMPNPQRNKIVGDSQHWLPEGGACMKAHTHFENHLAIQSWQERDSSSPGWKKLSKGKWAPVKEFYVEPPVVETCTKLAKLLALVVKEELVRYQEAALYLGNSTPLNHPFFMTKEMQAIQRTVEAEYKRQQDMGVSQWIYPELATTTPRSHPFFKEMDMEEEEIPMALDDERDEIPEPISEPRIVVQAVPLRRSARIAAQQQKLMGLVLVKIDGVQVRRSARNLKKKKTQKI
ncbi:MAG: hypothetical protein SGARI_001354 [Bacillariaceae sp.]